MNIEDIIRMAKQAGFERLGHDEHDYVCYPDEIVAFAMLIVKHEREACAKVCENYGRAEEMQAIGNDFAEQILAMGQE
jgi:hypothetical protein